MEFVRFCRTFRYYTAYNGHKIAFLQTNNILKEEAFDAGFCFRTSIMELFIKNMVSLRCIHRVKYELNKLGLNYTLIEMGRIQTSNCLSVVQMDSVRIALKQSGLELIDNKRTILIERIKHVIIEMVHYSVDPLKMNFSNHLSNRLNLDYTYLANIFSEHQGTTIENYIILNKIYRVKELIGHNQLNLTQISLLMHYSSVAHLSTQFKKVTGFTPSQFKQQDRGNQFALDKV